MQERTRLMARIEALVELVLADGRNAFHWSRLIFVINIRRMRELVFFPGNKLVILKLFALSVAWY